MAEPTPRPGLLPERGDELQAYRPLSGLAIAGLIVAALYATIVIIGGFAAFSSRSPLLLPLFWSILVPLVGAGLCFAAKLQIRGSEGTRAGLALANWGWWLSVVFGMGYLAFYAATYFAIRGQADDHVQRWFERVGEGQLNRAFLMSQEPAVQRNVNPEDELGMRIRFDVSPDPSRPGPLTMFRQMELIRALQQGGKDTKITPMGVREWEAVGQTYTVRRGYRISSPLGEYEALVSAQGTSSTKGEFEGRQWQIRGEATTVTDRKLTAKGQRLDALRRESQLFTQKWFDKLAAGVLSSAYEDTCDPGERLKLETIYTTRMVFLNMMAAPPLTTATGTGASTVRLAALMNPVWSLENFMPGYREQTEKLIRIEERKIVSDDEAMRKSLAHGLRQLFRPTGKSGFVGAIVDAHSTMRDAPVFGERLQLTHDCQLGFPPTQGVVEVTVESSPGYEDADKVPTWKIVRVEAVSAKDMTKQVGKPGMMPPGM